MRSMISRHCLGRQVRIVAVAISLSCACQALATDLPTAKAGEPLANNTFTLLRNDNLGARRGGAVRYVGAVKSFLLWGFMDADPEFLQENPSMPLPEHDVVYFASEKKQWRDHVSKEWAQQQAEKKPLYF